MVCACEIPAMNAKNKVAQANRLIAPSPRFPLTGHPALIHLVFLQKVTLAF
jgi:hypothetical protein